MTAPGNIFYQYGSYKESQLLALQALLDNDSSFIMPYYLFGDNNLDKYRDNERRIYFGGQSLFLGKFDRSFGYGITVQKIIKKGNQNKITGLFEFTEFKEYMDKEFEILYDKIKNGHDIVIPYPSKKDLIKQKATYFFDDNNDDDTKISIPNIKHNLGTQIKAKLSNKCLLYIQTKIDKLQSMAGYWVIMDTVTFPVKNELSFIYLLIYIRYIEYVYIIAEHGKKMNKN